MLTVRVGADKTEVRMHYLPLLSMKVAQLLAGQDGKGGGNDPQPGSVQKPTPNKDAAVKLQEWLDEISTFEFLVRCLFLLDVHEANKLFCCLQPLLRI